MDSFVTASDPLRQSESAVDRVSLADQRSSSAGLHGRGSVVAGGWWITILALVAVALYSVVSILHRPIAAGDSLEYVMQTQAIALHGTLAIPLNPVREYFNQTNPFGAQIASEGSETAANAAVTDRESSACSGLHESCQRGGGWGSLYQDRFGGWRYVHSPLYSLVAAPIYFVLNVVHGTGTLEYYSFRIANVLALLMVVGLIAAKVPTTRFLFLLATVFLSSPIIAYLSWDHPEVLQWSLIVAAFFLITQEDSRASELAPFLVAVAAIQNFPILAFLVPLWLMGPRRLGWQTLLRYIAAAAIGLSFVAYSYWYFGVPSPIGALGHASTEFISVGKVLAFLGSPSMGGVWCYPGVVFLAAILFFTKRSWPLVALVLVTFALTAMMCAMANMHSAMEGSSRYLCWIVAPWFGVVAASSWERYRPFTLGIIAVAVLTIYVVFGLPALDRAEAMPRVTFDRSLESLAATWYPAMLCGEDPETLYELMENRELFAPWQFDAPAQARLSSGDLWVIPRRGLRKGNTVDLPYDQLPPTYFACPPQKAMRSFRGKVMLRAERKLRFEGHPVLGDYLLLFVPRNRS